MQQVSSWIISYRMDEVWSNNEIAEEIKDLHIHPIQWSLHNELHKYTNLYLY